MKYSTDEYAITKRVDESIRHKVSDLQLATKTKRSIHITFVTPYGLKENSHSGSMRNYVHAYVRPRNGRSCAEPQRRIHTMQYFFIALLHL